ncbi:uncharacterized protein LOC112563938 [Pomacea canaliculata]|uniref:uncharacterized protein LOC112563938 n=1 Tax=Pomacea canaliculata TaxID=400727 RepID=UPI000D7301D4|nr:uncharacterized protein LOC112563938 [Pomacea canaliculata]
MIITKDREVNADGKKMTHGSVGVLVAATALCLCFGACVGQPMSVQWTLFSRRKPWSAAQVVCEMMGGYLASPDTSHKLSAFVHFLNNSPWNSSLTAGAYIGLMKPNETSSGWCWLGNCSLSVDSLLGTPLRIESCVSLSSVRPYTNPCTNANEYICETQKGPCTYEEMQDTIVAADINYTEDINHLTQILRQQEVGCKRLCDIKGEDCWAVAVVAGTDRCRTYQTSLPFLFDDKSKVMSEIGSTLYIKRCYTALLGSTSFEFIRYKTVSPASPCSSDQSGRVYVLVMKPATAHRARDHCLAMNYKLAGSNVTRDREEMLNIINSFYPEIVNLSDPLWIDHQTGFYSSPTLFRLDTGSFSTYNEHEHPFLCETHMVLQQSTYSQDIITNEEVTEANVPTKSINIQDTTRTGTQTLSISTPATTRGGSNTTTGGSNTTRKHVQDTNISDTLTEAPPHHVPQKQVTDLIKLTFAAYSCSTESDVRDINLVSLVLEKKRPFYNYASSST